ncbi:hypothetical protein F9288_00975 [Sphingomonas sp. CL5.1]|uniref:FecR family protein n=1 Tax=Sphingomonas sp. CL5.1 TaxID=2653203 RepID=UPI001582EEFD|nr:FecR domain-containing protein [Sphingomonas sp. CL5.1]QKR98370.1 hypothetical protein F9288_00975 [Sphingomonas sp. CL5.1]
MTGNDARKHELGERAEMVFAQYLTDQGKWLHSADRAEAERFVDFLQQFDRPEERAPRRGGNRRMIAAAAAILAAVGGMTGWMLRPAAPDVASYATGHAERRAIRLDDGSIIELAAESKVDVRYSARQREVFLRSGEALFTVTHNGSRPFSVAAADGRIVDIGTKFDVRVGKDEAQVTVVEGQVRVGVSHRTQPEGDGIFRDLGRGQRVNFGVRRDRGVAIAYMGETRQVDADDAQAWTRGKLFFDGEPLERAIAIVNSYAADQLVLKEPKLRNMPVFGMLDQSDVQGLLSLVNDPQAIEVRRHPGNSATPR